MDSKIHKLLILLLFIAIPIAGLAFVTPDAHAFMFYSDATNDQGGCAQCHTGFRDNGNYVSLAEGVPWNDSLHNVHVQDTSVGDDCGHCHDGAGVSGRTVNIGSSAVAADGVNAISCTGCHVPEGLRAHHAVNGVALCAGCHPNDPPSVPENVAPPWYGSVTNNISGTLMEPCNLNGEEQVAVDGLPIGLDNDGDNAYDAADSDCVCQPTGVSETICNGIDDNCDGQIDEGYMVDDTCGLGVCGPPNNTPSSCVDGVETPCQPGPQDEATDVTCDGVDGDCDGQVDEDYMPMPTTCGIGECANTGETACVNGVVEDTCTPLPAPEPGMEMTCDDGLDNDCDGSFDDVANNPVNPDPDCTGCTDMDNDGFSPDGGTCGLIDCNDMDNTIFPGADETACNGIDNDCDLLIDEDYMQMPTTCGIGVCASTGQTTCVGGVEGDTCVAGPPDEATDVTCDGLDGDCDGQVDEDYMIDAACGLGVCGPPNNTPSSCVSGVETLCQPGPQDEATDVTCDGVDGDCDGMIDEDFVTSTTSCGIGICASNGLLECVGGNEVDSCMPGSPGVEGPDGDPTCSDGIDNDCDGATDTAQDPDCGAEVTIPPPVQQNLGFPDSSIADLIEDDCRFCHEDGTIVDDPNIPNRHHLRVNTPIQTPLTARPFPSGDTNGNYDCYSCHNLIWDPNTQSSQFQTFRDCIFCHNAFSPHHVTAQAQAQNCDFCHGPVDNPFDGHPVGQNPPSLVTPNRSCGDGLPAHFKDNGLPVFAGGCDYCHDSGLTSGTASNGIITAKTNKETHHETGFFAQGVCDWCHLVIPNGNADRNDPDRCATYPPDPFDIRTCERCHGISSIHNIQVDSDAAGLVDTTGDGVGDTENIGNIIPNFENPYWGHIGNNDDCWGCHGYSFASGPSTGPIIPNIYLLSAYSVTEGADSTLTIEGSALSNTVHGPTGTVVFDSVIVLTADDGTTTTLDTLAISETSMDVTVPGTLAAGTYVLHAVKDINSSNAVGFTVIPAVTITNVDCNKKQGILTITGSGYSKKPEGTDGDLNVQINGAVVGLADLISWTDTQIKVSVGRCTNRDAVSVNALFGSASDGKPCKSRKCR